MAINLPLGLKKIVGPMVSAVLNRVLWETYHKDRKDKYEIEKFKEGCVEDEVLYAFFIWVWLSSSIAEFFANLLSVMGMVNILIKLTSHVKIINGG